MGIRGGEPRVRWSDQLRLERERLYRELAEEQEHLNAWEDAKEHEIQARFKATGALRWPDETDDAWARAWDEDYRHSTEEWERFG